MNDNDLAGRLETALTEQLARLGEEQRAAAENARTVALDQTSVGRLSRMDAMQQQAMAQAALNRLQVQRRRVEAALARMQAGRYGECCDCGVVIGLPRLVSDPAAPFCVDCQAEIDAERVAR